MVRLWHYGVIIGFSLLWSSAFIAGKIAMADLGPLSILFFRFLLSAAVLLPFCLGAAGVAFNRRVIGNGVLLGILNNALYLGLTFTALSYISPALVIVVVSCAPFLTTLLSAATGLETIRPRQIAGIATGFSGVLLISGVSGLSADDLLGLTFAVLGTAAFSLGTVFLSGRTRGLRVRDLNLWQSAAGALALLPFMMLLEPDPAPPSIGAIAAIVYLALAVTVGGMALWFWLVRTDGPAAASSYHLMNPGFGMLLSALLLDSPLTVRGLLGAVVIGVGLFMTMTPKRR